jgi:hypothetical protein
VRLAELREATGRALPGTSWVVSEAAPGFGTDVFPCANGQAQDRALFGTLLKMVEANDLWSADRHFCTRALLCDLDSRGAFFITREHRGLPVEMRDARRECGRPETGSGAPQRVKVVDEHGQDHVFRRVRITLKPATRDGATIGHMLTNVPRRVAGQRVADLSRQRWTLDTAFQHLEAYLHAAITTLGSPKAALFGFCLALGASKVLAVVWAAWRGVHGEEIVDAEGSLYYIANDIATPSHGMMIAIPAPEWAILYAMSPADLALTLLQLAHKVRLQAMRKSPRRSKKPHSQGKKLPRKGPIATAKLLMNRKANVATP